MSPGAIRVPFRCQFCITEQTVDLVALARAGRVACVSCKRGLSRAQVSEAIGRARRHAASTAAAEHAAGRVGA